jgi:hypothetical protein
MQHFLQFIILTFIYSSTCFGVLVPIIRSSTTAVAASGFTFGYHQDPKVNSEADTTVAELLMMGMRTPETC